MNTSREKQRLPTPDGASCSICLETVESAVKRSVARLKCSHVFHLDCIGSAFNAKGAMQCPNCRQVEGGQWLYSNGSLMQQDNFERNDYARLLVEVAYLHNENERHEEGFNEIPRWPRRLDGHYAISQEEEEDPLMNRYPYPRADERQHQGVQRHQTSGIYMPSMPGLEHPRHAAPAIEITRRSALMEVERPRHQDLWTSRGSTAYVQSLQPILPRSYDQSNVNPLPEIYPSHMFERSGFRRQMDDDGYEERSMYRWPGPAGGRFHRGPSDIGAAFNPPHAHLLRDFGLQGRISSLEQSNINRSEVARYGHFARRAVGYYPLNVSNGLQELTSHSLSNGYDGHSSHFDNRGALWMGRRIPQL